MKPMKKKKPGKTKLAGFPRPNSTRKPVKKTKKTGMG